ncbi:DUF4232 domain-containing protein [Streptomyces sp. NPDC005329]|uniref:DUF4232 domain-containing protein n=1 Tax=Streptomyces sp. NPDC005329 TaxID=3157034 RepID=UPI0033BC2440
MRYGNTGENANENTIANADANTNENTNRNGNGHMRWNRFGMRASVMAAVVASTALMVTGCDSGESSSASVDPASAGPASATPAPVTSPSVTSSSVASSSVASPVASAAVVTPAVASSPAGAAPVCSPGSLKVAARQAADRPAGTGTGAAIVEFTNGSTKACVLKGHPTVAGAGNGSPEKNAPLSVTTTGSASPVKLAPGGKAWVKLTFVQVQGEADGFCESGAEPVVYPTLVVGLPGAGKYQVALDDGQFAQCDNKVTVTAVSAVKPS